MQQKLPLEVTTAELFDEQRLWDADTAADLTPACAALFSAHARGPFTSEDIVLSVQQLSNIFSDVKLPRSSASAVCSMIAALICAAGHSYGDVLPEITELVGAALGVLQAKQGADAFDMNLYLLAALHHAALAQDLSLIHI